MANFKVATLMGLAIFSMFFGSGNLIFPLSIGMQTGSNYLTASIGLVLTGIIIPFAGLYSMILYRGNKDLYFGIVGKHAPIILSLLMLGLLGPFGVIPRCIIVSFGGISLIWPNLSFIVFSSIFVLVILFSILEKSKIIPLIGKYLSPLLLGGIALIIICAFLNKSGTLQVTDAVESLQIGLKEGYQTMDLLAAFFFAISIIEYITILKISESDIPKITLQASVIGSGLLALVYIGFVMLGAYYAPHLTKIEPPMYLATIAHLTFGAYAKVIIAITIILACLTTSISLAQVFANFLAKDLCKGKISHFSSIVITIIVSFLLSLLGFSSISKILGVILEYLYPALILLTIIAIANKYFEFKYNKLTFWMVIIITAGCKLVNFEGINL